MLRRWRVFVEEYLKCWDGAKAARQAGYSEKSAARTAHKLLQKTEIQEHIRARLDEIKMGTDEALQRLSEQARNLGSQYLQQSGEIDLQQLIADGNQHLVKGTRWDRQGNLVVEFHDAQRALELVGKAHSIFTDKVELSGNLDIIGIEVVRPEEGDE